LTDNARAAASRRLNDAVRRNRTLSRAGLAELMFTWAFKGLVYPQIWEDPEIDMEALALTPDCHLVTIASGGCNVLSYLVDDPKRITAVDLSLAHVALNRLKLTAVQRLPSWDSFYRFFGDADDRSNVDAYWCHLAAHLDPDTRRYWERRRLFGFGRQRIGMFARNMYRYGLLGTSIGIGHLVARIYGIDPRKLLHARSLDEQRELYRTSLAPLFEKRLVRWATARPLSLYGLGIPPAQYGALAPSGDMASVLRERVERLACAFSFSENYFAWQAFGRSYPDPHQRRAAAALPAPRQLRCHPRPRRPRRGVQPLVHRIPRNAAGRFARPLRAAGCAGLDERRPAQRAVARDHPHGQAGRARDLPHRRRAEPAAGPDRRCDPRSLALPGRAIAHADATRPFGDLWRLPPLCLGRMSITQSTALMNRIYRHQRLVYDPTRKYFLLGRDRLIERLQPREGHEVLELGCGTGRNLILAARRYPKARFFGLDVSTEMLTSAIEAIARSGLAARVRVTHADAGGFNPRELFGTKRFDRIFISYSLSMISRWEAVLEHAVGLLAPDGELHIVDFGGQERLPQWFRDLLRQWLALFEVTPRDRLEATLTVLAERRGATLTVERPHRGYAQHAILRRAA